MSLLEETVLGVAHSGVSTRDCDACCQDPPVWLVPIMLPTAWEVACFLTLLPVQCVIKLFFFLTLILDISKHTK